MACSFCGKEKHTSENCFERVKKEVSLVDVLAHYGIEVKSVAGGFRAKCPLPDHQGERIKTPFAITENGAGFHCWSCHAKGNVISFVEKMEGVKASEAVKILSAWSQGTERAMPQLRQTVTIEQPPEANIPLKDKWSKPGKPSDGRLKDLDHAHPFLQARGFSEELCRDWGVGFIKKGGSAGRIGFPICNQAGDVVAYATRATQPDQEPRWHQPEGFHKNLELFGIDRVEGELVIVTESLWGPMALARAGIPNGVALMGSSLSDAQDALLAPYNVVLMLDGDASGREGTKAIAARFIESGRSFRVVSLPLETQPDTLDAEELQNMIGALL